MSACHHDTPLGALCEQCVGANFDHLRAKLAAAEAERNAALRENQQLADSLAGTEATLAAEQRLLAAAEAERDALRDKLIGAEGEAALLRKHREQARARYTALTAKLAEATGSEANDDYWVCPQCGPRVVVDFDECCTMCGATTAPASRLREFLLAARAALTVGEKGGGT